MIYICCFVLLKVFFKIRIGLYILTTFSITILKSALDIASPCLMPVRQIHHYEEADIHSGVKNITHLKMCGLIFYTKLA
jgi:hypothetical protein